MIKNDKQLAIVREQLANAEAALDSLRREVLPKNKNMYEVMSESYIDTIRGLQWEVEAFRLHNDKEMLVGSAKVRRDLFDKYAITQPPPN